MTPVYAISLVVGAVLLLAWIAAVAVADMVPGWQHVDPDAKFGSAGRTAVAAVLGFGLGGMSSSFAGWPAVAAIAAAAGGALGVAAAARYLTTGAHDRESA